MSMVCYQQSIRYSNLLMDCISMVLYELSTYVLYFYGMLSAIYLCLISSLLMPLMSMIWFVFKMTSWMLSTSHYLCLIYLWCVFCMLSATYLCLICLLFGLTYFKGHPDIFFLRLKLFKTRILGHKTFYSVDLN